MHLPGLLRRGCQDTNVDHNNHHYCDCLCALFQCFNLPDNIIPVLHRGGLERSQHFPEDNRATLDLNPRYFIC